MILKVFAISLKNPFIFPKNTFKLKIMVCDYFLDRQTIQKQPNTFWVLGLLLYFLS